MLFEQRMYTLTSEPAERFWILQHERGFELVRPIMERLVGYFSTRIGSQDVIVHWWRFDDYEDWRRRLHGLYEVQALLPYFKQVRAILSAQENKFLTISPVQELNPIWSPSSDWLPGQASPAIGPLTPECLVDMQVIQLRPGGLPSYWQAWRSMGPDLRHAMQHRLMGVFHTLVGPLHEVTVLRWHPSQREADEWRRRMESQPEWAALQGITSEWISHTRQLSLRPAPGPELSPLFA
jgi:hypothetical protein